MDKGTATYAAIGGVSILLVAVMSVIAAKPAEAPEKAAPVTVEPKAVLPPKPEPLPDPEPPKIDFERMLKELRRDIRNDLEDFEPKQEVSPPITPMPPELPHRGDLGKPRRERTKVGLFDGLFRKKRRYRHRRWHYIPPRPAPPRPDNAPRPHEKSPWLRSESRFPEMVQTAAILSSVVTTSHPDARGKTSRCTGTIVGFQQAKNDKWHVYVLTAGHCVRGGIKHVDFIWRDGRPSLNNPCPKRVIARPRGHDVAIIQIEHSGPIPWAMPIRPHNPTPPFDVLSLGTDRASVPWSWDGRVVRSGHEWITDKQPWHGRSGGGLFDQKGHLLGVCSAYDSYGRGHFVHLRGIHQACDEAGLSWLYGGKDKAPRPRPTPPPKECPPEPQ